MGLKPPVCFSSRAASPSSAALIFALGAGVGFHLLKGLTGAAQTNPSRPLQRGLVSLMSNISADRRPEGDWWQHPIPENVVWDEGLYCETAQVFRFVKSKKNPAVEFGKCVSVYAGCSFSIGPKGHCKIGDYTLLNGALIMAEESIEIGSHCLISWCVGIADSDFHPLDPALRRIDAMAISPYSKPRPERPEVSC
jgi:hypothetical protein